MGQMIRPLGSWFLVCCAILLLTGCERMYEEPTISKENAEDVKLVLYLGGYAETWKDTSGETILIDTGERLSVQHDKVRPDPQFMTKDWGRVFDPAFKSTVHIGQVPLKLDRKTGVVCDAKACAAVYMICPSWAEQNATKKECISFGRK